MVELESVERLPEITTGRKEKHDVNKFNEQFHVENIERLSNEVCSADGAHSFIRNDISNSSILKEQLIEDGGLFCFNISAGETPRIGVEKLNEEK